MARTSEPRSPPDREPGVHLVLVNVTARPRTVDVRAAGERPVRTRVAVPANGETTVDLPGPTLALAVDTDDGAHASLTPGDEPLVVLRERSVQVVR